MWFLPVRSLLSGGEEAQKPSPEWSILCCDVGWDRDTQPAVAGGNGVVQRKGLIPLQRRFPSRPSGWEGVSLAKGRRMKGPERGNIWQDLLLASWNQRTEDSYFHLPKPGPDISLVTHDSLQETELVIITPSTSGLPIQVHAPPCVSDHLPVSLQDCEPHESTILSPLSQSLVLYV